MDLKYYKARSSINKTPKQSYRDDTEEIFNKSLINAPNVFNDVELEKTYGKRDFERAICRVDSVINPSTGYKYGDDYKSFVFSPSIDKVFVGKMIRWENNYWLCINANTYESSTNAGIYRRCNNAFRWIDANGNKISEPCIIDYNIMEGGDYQGKDTTTISGFEKIWCQRNDRSNQIKSNQRFLFGIPSNPVCYKIYGNGIRNFMNSETFDYNSPSVIEFTIGANYLNASTDDFENLIADAYINRYSIVIDQGDIEQTVGFTTNLTATIKENGEIISKPIIWKSFNSSICTVDKNGNLTCNSIGETYVKVYLLDNPEIQNIVEIKVVSELEDKYSIILSADNYNYDNEIIQGDEVLYSCYLYKNNEIQTDAFVFTLNTEANSNCYKFLVVDDNHFKIKNLKRSLSRLNITCTSGDNIYEHSITLKGAW